MTARPQDVALLPLPKWATLNAHLRLSPWALQQRLRDYARANVTAALASAQAREDELRALLREAQPFIGWTGSYTELHAKIDAALSTNAATQTGETNEAAE